MYFVKFYRALIAYSLCVCLCFMAFSCEKPVFEDNIVVPPSQGMNVVFNVSQFEQIPFDERVNRSTDIATLVNRISLAIYQDGKKIQQINQEAADNDFGQLKLSLAAGKYQMAIIAHNGQKSPTMTNIEKITFDGNKLTDTFYYCDSLMVSNHATYDLTLKRAVAMVRFMIEDAMPNAVTQMQFYYTGGSSTFDAIKGVGNVNSKQTELRDVTTEMHGKSTSFDVYTFPHADAKPLKMVVTAKAGDITMVERTFENIGVTRNMMTRYSGQFFTDSNPEDTTANASFVLKTNDVWTVSEQTY